MSRNRGWILTAAATRYGNRMLSCRSTGGYTALTLS